MKYCLNILLSIIFWGITFFSLWFLDSDHRIATDDSLRHNKFASYINEYGFIENDTHHNWWDITEHSLLDTYNVDLWQWHHLLLSYILKLWVPLDDLNRYYITLLVIILVFITLTFNSILQNKTIIWLSVVSILIFCNADSYMRLILARPYLLTTIFFLSILIILYKKKYLWLSLIFLIWTYYHALFYFLFLPLYLPLYLHSRYARRWW